MQFKLEEALCCFTYTEFGSFDYQPASTNQQFYIYIYNSCAISLAICSTSYGYCSFLSGKTAKTVSEWHNKHSRWLSHLDWPPKPSDLYPIENPLGTLNNGQNVWNSIHAIWPNDVIFWSVNEWILMRQPKSWRFHTTSNRCCH